MQLNHYLNFKGQTEAAFLFYQSVFGGTFSNMTRYGDMPPEDGVNLTEEERNFIMHVSLPLNEHTELMGSDYMEAFCGNNAKGFIQGNNHYISINLVNDETETRRLFNQLSVHGHIECPLEKTFWGALFGSFVDQFGVQWMVNCQLDATHDSQDIAL
ncbi:PhnB protein [Acinetobacter marinus]|uniref:PhnB protein n=1 Tax=Acinetobacter marinus TaxID=281375 RepID=A0A1G6KXN1_9GAMM|nr:VOC family protein [Acinetobacter marinus]SDC35859.1 PhnB protein [Acinetobacter marinus]